MVFIIRFLVRTFLMGLIILYRLLVRPYLCGYCRFEPHCSLYAWQALQSQPTGHAIMNIGMRLIQCHPWSQRPLFDPPSCSGDKQ